MLKSPTFHGCTQSKSLGFENMFIYVHPPYSTLSLIAVFFVSLRLCIKNSDEACLAKAQFVPVFSIAIMTILRDCACQSVAVTNKSKILVRPLAKFNKPNRSNTETPGKTIKTPSAGGSAQTLWLNASKWCYRCVLSNLYKRSIAYYLIA